MGKIHCGGVGRLATCKHMSGLETNNINVSSAQNANRMVSFTVGH